MTRGEMTQRLCLFTDSHEPSGVGEHMLALAAELQGHYCLSFVCPPSPTGRLVLARARALGIETLALDAGDELRSTGPLCDWLRARRVDIFHCHAGIRWEGHVGIHTARAAGVPVVLRTEHLPYLIDAPADCADHGRMVEATDRLICVSDAVRASFLAAGIPAHKLRCIRNGVTPGSRRTERREPRPRLGLAWHARLVLTVGRLTEQKGHRYLLEAIPAVVAREPEVDFLWAGEGPLEGELRERARALGVAPWVHFLGRRDDIGALLAAADLFVLPALFEGLPLAALEAMAAGLPVVGTRVCGTSEAVADGITGRLVPAGDADALADAILEVLTRPELAAGWGAAGRLRVVREFSAARMARETMAVYNDLLGQVAPAQHAVPHNAVTAWQDNWAEVAGE